MNEKVYIATLSGGKDSTAMCDLLLKNGYPVDFIVFNDTLDEFYEMYEYINKVEEYFKSRYNKTITRLKPIKTYDEYIFNIRRRGDNIGKIMGLPNSSFQFCEWRRDSKIIPMQNWLKEKNIKNYYVYFGFTIDEQNRKNGDMNLYANGKPLFPLIDIFKMSERDCQEYLISQDMENPLYKFFTRTGCAKCPYQSDRNFFNIWKHFPKKWQETKDLEKRVWGYHIEAVSSRFFSKYRTAEEMETKFIKADKQGRLFDFSDDPIKDCFCKI